MSRVPLGTLLVDLLTEDRSENRAVFDTLVLGLRELAETSDTRLVLVVFHIRLLDALGYRPELRECVSCRSAIEPNRNHFSALLGGVICPGCGPHEPTAKAIVERFKSKNIDPEGYTLYTYAAMQVWSQAAKKAGTIEPKKVMDTIKANAWDTVIGKLEFDAKGDIKQIDYVVYRWDAKGNYAEIDPGKGT